MYSCKHKLLPNVRIVPRFTCLGPGEGGSQNDALRDTCLIIWQITPHQTLPDSNYSSSGPRHDKCQLSVHLTCAEKGKHSIGCCWRMVDPTDRPIE